jgi:uncharacterized membrane protein
VRAEIWGKTWVLFSIIINFVESTIFWVAIQCSLVKVQCQTFRRNELCPFSESKNKLGN